MGVCAVAASAVPCLPAQAQGLAAPNANEQLEADLRVIAARCGTPAFEKVFFKESKAAVAAGLINKSRDAGEVEQRISTLRRSPFVLVAAPSDCPAQLVRLKEIQKSRAGLVKSTRGRKS